LVILEENIFVYIKHAVVDGGV